MGAEISSVKIFLKAKEKLTLNSTFS